MGLSRSFSFGHPLTLGKRVDGGSTHVAGVPNGSNRKALAFGHPLRGRSGFDRIALGHSLRRGNRPRPVRFVGQRYWSGGGGSLA